MSKTAVETRVLVQELQFNIGHIILSNGSEIAGPFFAIPYYKCISGKDKSSKLWMMAYLQNADGECFDLAKYAGGRFGIAEVDYQMIYRDSRHTGNLVDFVHVSPVFRHTFKEEQVAAGGMPQMIGKMKMCNAEQVWPELTSEGYYGNLPQFYL